MTIHIPSPRIICPQHFQCIESTIAFPFPIIQSFSRKMSSPPPFPPLSAEVELLRRQYLQLLDPKSLTIPDSHILKQPEIQSQIFNALFRDGSLTYPPPVGYRTRVLKLLVNALEKAMTDPDEDVGMHVSSEILFISIPNKCLSLRPPIGSGLKSQIFKSRRRQI